MLNVDCVTRASGEKIVKRQLIWGSVPTIELAQRKKFSVAHIFGSMFCAQLSDDGIGFPEV